MTLMTLNVIMLNATANTPTKPKATAPILASQLDHLVSHQLSVAVCSGKPPASAVIMFEEFIIKV